SVTTDGPSFIFHVRANTKPFTQTDGLAGQTATKTAQGVRSLRLLKDASDPAPALVFDHGKDFVEAGYDDGDDTVVGSAKIATIASGHYTLARIGVTHSKFTVNATLHAAGGAFPGSFDCTQTLSDDVTLDGKTHTKGWYKYIFTTGGMSYPQEGDGAPLPTTPGTGGFTLHTDGAQAYYEVPFDVTLDGSEKKDMNVVTIVNMDHAFRWEDETKPGYASGVYDTTATEHEIVRRFGANSFVVTIE
ncbi:MAG: hypothetical protein ACXVEF_05730, partial [Polyangiales bacterium]